MKVEDHNFTKGLLKNLKEVSVREIRVGVLGSNAQEQVTDEITMAGLAAVHEFGTDRAGRNRNVTIPERSFIRATWDDKKIMRKAAKKGREVYKRFASPAQITDGIGALAASAVKQKIQSNIPPALKPATVRAKGSSVALVDTGRLINSIDFEVIRK
jgi:phage gpG-like protein